MATSKPVTKRRGRAPLDPNLSDEAKAKLLAAQRVNAIMKGLRALSKMRGLGHDQKGDIIEALDAEIGATKTAFSSQTVQRLFEFKR